MIVRVKIVGPLAMNAYVLGCRESGKCVLIDPGGEVPALLEIASRLRLETEAIWLTHGHIDHVAGVAEAVRLTGAPVALHVDDRFLYEAAPQQAQSVGMVAEELPEPAQWLRGGEVLALGELGVEVLHVPGHSPGHVAFWVPSGRAVFSGDCVFAGSIGRSDLPGGSHATLMASVERVIFTLGDDVRIYAGHGPPTSVESERRTNPFFSSAAGGGAVPDAQR